MNFFDRLFNRRRDAFRGQADRDWRVLVPQDVQRVPAGDLGRKRAVRSRLPLVLSIIFFCALGGLLWWAVDESTTVTPAVGSVRFTTDGFINPGVVQKLIAQGEGGAMRDIRVIKAELEADNQVLTADVRRRADGTLEVALKERVAVAKVVVRTSPIVVRLVATDGLSFTGAGYPEQAVRQLIEITDYRSTGSDTQLMIEGIEIAAPFLAEAQARYGKNYRDWSALSLRDCFGAQEEAPGSNLRVTVRPGSQPLDRPTLAAIIFSTANWRNELALLQRINIDELLRRPGVLPGAYELKMSIQNRTSPTPVPEPRLVPLLPPPRR